MVQEQFVYLMEKNTVENRSQVIPSQKTLTMYTNRTTTLKYTLLNVTSDTDFPQIHRTLPIVLHGKCTSDVPSRRTSPPDTFFCMDETTGYIYTTSELDVKLISGEVKFFFTVLVVDEQVFPMRRATMNLTLHVFDDCSPASGTYEKLASCVNYLIVDTSKRGEAGHLDVMDDFIQFTSNTRLQRLLSLNVEVSPLNMVPGIIHFNVCINEEQTVCRLIIILKIYFALIYLLEPNTLLGRNYFVSIR